MLHHQSRKKNLLLSIVLQKKMREKIVHSLKTKTKINNTPA